MKILICLSCVPDTTSKINFTDDDSKFDKSGIQFIINPYDEFGLTKAMMLKETNGFEITAITVGDVSVEPILRKALAIGADKAVRINHDPKDSYSTAVEIASYIKNNSFDLIITGRESIDYNGCAVPGMISEILNLPFVNACINLEINNNSIKMIREIDGGKETIQAQMPIVVAGQKGLVEESDLRIPNMRGIMQARNKPLNIVEPINTTVFTQSIKFEKPKEKEECKLIDAGNVTELINLLKNEAKVI